MSCRIKIQILISPTCCCIFESFKGDLSCLVGLSGLLPLHPQTYMEAARNRKAAEEKARKVDEEKVNDDQESTDTAEDTR